MTLRKLNYGSYGIFLTMGNAGFSINRMDLAYKVLTLRLNLIHGVLRFR